MSSLDHLPLRAKLLLAPALCLLLLVLSAAGAIWGFAAQRHALDSLYEQRLPSYTFASRFESGLRDLNGLINRSIGYTAMGFNEKEVEAIDKALASTAAALQKALADQAAIAATDEDRAVLKALAEGFKKYVKAINETVDIKSTGAAVAVTFLSVAQAEYERLIVRISQVSREKLAAAGEDVAAARAAAARAQWTIAAAAVGAIVSGVGLAMLLAGGLLARVRETSQAAERLAAGDLRSTLRAKGRDEIGRLMGHVEVVREHLATAIQAVQTASDSVKLAAGDIASGNADLSHRTEQQASSLQQTAATMEQFTATAKSNAETAHTASQLASAASEVATRGGAVVSEVVQTMEQISQSSRRIAEIIGTIDGIAFQTNILALNAAVEAARAAEHGRGFAVVAGEVRALAQRSAQAAREIKGLIGGSVESVQAGTRLVGDAGTTIGEVVQQVRRVSELIAEISVASKEQTSGFGQVNGAITHLDQVTQQNAALVQQSASAAEGLRRQADELAAAIGVFRVVTEPDGARGRAVEPALA
ncbi:MAG: HAMP domain-containing protein [Rubrivivax sp.]|nr:HAMP domain-containing protein [Rubrivivax sp.]